MEADLRQKLEHAKEVSQVAKGTLNDFSLQKMQLETFIDQMTNWLNKVEESVLKYTNSQEPEELKKLKVHYILNLLTHIFWIMLAE